MGALSRLRGRISILVAIGVVLVAAGVAVLLVNTFALRSSADSTNRADAYLLRVVSVERLVVDAETGLRGAVITGRTLFLQPLHGAQSQLAAAIVALRQSAADGHADQKQSTALITAVRSYMLGYVPNTLRLVAHDLPAARSLAVTLEGKHQVDAIRGRVAELERAVSRSQAARQRSAHATANRSILEAIVVLVLLTVLTAALGGYLGHLVVTRERARRRSEATARVLQRSILPTADPTIPGCELATRFIPGGSAVSGDFYDVVEIPGGGWALIIGDVCGKGAAAAAATAMARWTLRSSLATGATPAEALRFLNDVAVRHDHDGRFITAACLKLTFESGLARVVVACAGHPAPILVPRVAAPSALPAEGELVGVLPTIRLRTAEVQLGPGDSLVAYTDGVTDQGPEPRRSPEQALQGRTPDAGANELAGILEDLAHRPEGRHPDDIAILALRFQGPGVEEPPLAVATAASAEERDV
jgi:CHASE3 domain sensor protein